MISHRPLLGMLRTTIAVIGLLISVPVFAQMPPEFEKFIPPEFEKLMKELTARENEETAAMDEMMSAREISQAIGIAEVCGIDLDLAKVEAVAERIALASPEARLLFQTGGRAQKVRMESFNEAERAAACGSARATARKHNFIR